MNYAERKAEWERQKLQEMCQCPAIASELLIKGLVILAVLTAITTEVEAEISNYTTILTVDHNENLVVSEIGIEDLITRKNLS